MKTRIYATPAVKGFNYETLAPDYRVLCCFFPVLSSDPWFGCKPIYIICLPSALKTALNPRSMILVRTRCSSNAGLRLGQRRRRWHNLKPALVNGYCFLWPFLSTPNRVITMYWETRVCPPFLHQWTIILDPGTTLKQRWVIKYYMMTKDSTWINAYFFYFLDQNHGA